MTNMLSLALLVPALLAAPAALLAADAAPLAASHGAVAPRPKPVDKVRAVPRLDECRRSDRLMEKTTTTGTNACQNRVAFQLRLDSSFARSSRVGTQTRTVVTACVEALHPVQQAVTVSVGPRYYDGSPIRQQPIGGGAPYFIHLAGPFGTGQVKCGTVTFSGKEPAGNLFVQVDPAHEIDKCGGLNDKLTCEVSPVPTDLARKAPAPK